MGSGDSRLRIGLIGCGRISKKHLHVLHQLKDKVELTAVCDIENKRADETAKEWNVKAYYNVASMLRDEKLDVVSILTWSGNHASIAQQCASRVPNIIIEKPMALKLDDADRLIEDCSKLGTRLFVVKQNRYNPPVVALKKAIEQNRFGNLLVGTVRVRWCRDETYYQQDQWRGTWEMDGGVLTNQASHHIDLLTWMMGPVESVYAKTARFLAPIEAEDTGVVILKFKNGGLGIVEATTCARPKDLEGSLSILGEKGTVVIGGFAVNKLETWSFKDEKPEDSGVWDTSTAPPDVYGFGHYEFMLSVINCINNRTPFMIDGLEGRKSLELINAIYESVETGREVSLAFTPKYCRLGLSNQSSDSTPKPSLRSSLFEKLNETLVN